MRSFDAKDGCVFGYCVCNNCDGTQQRNQNHCDCHFHCQVSQYPCFCVLRDSKWYG
uniref:Uncharacterized protein n=1 Tax=Rhizophora mucronata TaxID=61149 RepID=A0A2P2N7J9_RHIMU